MKHYRYYLFDWGDTLMTDHNFDGPMHSWPKVDAFEGSVATLKELSKSAQCYVATNAKASNVEDIEKALSMVGLSEYIAGIFCYKSIGFEKPSAPFYQHIVTDLNADKSDIVMIGDNLENDVKGAMDFGIDAIWFNPKQLENTAGIVAISSLKELINW